VKAIIVPWVQKLPTSDAAPYGEALVNWYRQGGQLWLLQDDPFHDPIGTLLGVPTATATFGPRLTNGVAPTFEGPFGTARDVEQRLAVGALDPGDVAAHGGTVTGYAETGEAVVASWREHEYASGAGRMVIATDVDAAHLFARPPAHRIWSLNTIAFLLAADTTAPVITCDVSHRRLWPPTGEGVTVSVWGTVSNEDGTSPVSVSFEVTDEYGLHIPGGTVAVVGDGAFSFTVPLNASRHEDDRDGRLYTVKIRARDATGNTGTCTAVVTVPHDSRRRLESNKGLEPGHTLS
jgi:hypothetical protein